MSQPVAINNIQTSTTDENDLSQTSPSNLPDFLNGSPPQQDTFGLIRRMGRRSQKEEASESDDEQSEQLDQEIEIEENSSESETESEGQCNWNGGVSDQEDELGEELIPCQGCQQGLANQLAHTDPGGCLS